NRNSIRKEVLHLIKFVKKTVAIPTLSFLILWWKEIETEDMETGTEVFPTFVPHPSLWIERVQTSFGLFCLHCKQYFYF
ncbi:hypothetical protein H318_05991, partial [Enterococcus durans IPLA 655]